MSRSSSQTQRYKECRERGVCVTEGCSKQSEKFARCDTCRRVYNIKHRKYNKKYPERNRQTWLSYYERNGGYEQAKQKPRFINKVKGRLKNRYYLRTYGLSIQQVYSILELQEYSCAGCWEPLTVGRFDIDHDHISNSIRGILHPQCNKVLGLIKDSAKNAYNIAKYLEGTATNENFVLG